MDSAVDAPAVLRRKRKIARQQREKTPEARLSSQQYSDEESSSTADQQISRSPPKNHQYQSSRQPTTSPYRSETAPYHRQTVSPPHSQTASSQRHPTVSPQRQPTASPQYQPTTPPQRQPTALPQRQPTASPQRQSTTSPQRQPIALSQPSSHTTTTDDSGNYSIRMQIRPPAKMSAHESKILRRRNRGFAGTAARSQSQPRERDAQEELLYNEQSPEVSDLLRTARRSLSSTRHDDMTSESGHDSAPSTPAIEYSPLEEMQRKIAAGSQSADEEKFSKLERNLKKFDDERRKFEMEKKKFEREKREIHKIRYRQLMEAEERRRMLESTRKSSAGRIPSDSDEKYQRIERAHQQQSQVQQQRKKSPHRNQEKPIMRKQEFKQEVKQPHSILKYRPDYESSSAVSESDSEAVQADIEFEDSREHMKPTIRPISLCHPLGPPPIPPERKRSKSRSLSRNRSLSPLRSRKQSIETKIEDLKLEREVKQLEPAIEVLEIKPGLFRRFFSIFQRKKEKVDAIVPDTTVACEVATDESVNIKIMSWAFIKLLYRDCRREWIRMKLDHPAQMKRLRSDRNKCISHFIILALFCGFGGLIFRFIEGGFESSYKCEVRKVKRDFIDTLWTWSHSMREDDWKTQARNKLRTFEEELLVVHNMGLRYHTPKNTKWDFINSILYCLTVITSIGYGHIAPKTTLGQAITIIYSIIGIPIFLILLADFGRLFTRGIKFIWGFLRRLYYTGTCRRVRKTQQMQDMMKGINIAYDVAIRRPSVFIRDADIEKADRKDAESPLGEVNSETPTTPYPDTIIVDDEFNLPISVATGILITYILLGACIYATWEDWSYFESFYFVFISMSTIGFGDFVPEHPIFMMSSIIYLIFGLALTSMFINVVQIKLSDSFKQASAKISATIGLKLAEEMNSQMGESAAGGDTPSIHQSNLGNIQEHDDESKETDNGKISPPPLLPRASKP